MNYSIMMQKPIARVCFQLVSLAATGTKCLPILPCQQIIFCEALFAQITSSLPQGHSHLHRYENHLQVSRSPRQLGAILF